MLDDLRNSSENPFIEEEPYIPEAETPKPQQKQFLGMTAAQRFVISVFLFLMILILGIFVLIVFQKVYPVF